MAKAPVDTELRKALTASKRKAHYFALICKGVAVQKLIVRRKPKFTDGEIAKAKTEYKGNKRFNGVCYGGGGDKMVFELTGDDPPGRELVLKDHIATQTGLKFKPEYKIVTDLTEVDESDEGEVAEEPTAASQAAPPQEEPATEAPADSDALIKRRQVVTDTLKTLVPKVGDAVKADATRKDGLMQATKAVKDAISAAGGDTPDEAKVAAAESALKGLAVMLKEAAAGAPPPPPPPQEGADAGDAAQRKAIKDELKALKPSINERIKSDPGAKAAVLAAAQQVQKTVSGDVAEAQRALDALKELLGGTGEAAPTGNFDSLWPAAKQAWQDASDTVDGQITKLQSALKKTKDDELHEIAEFGLNGVTGDFKVPLMAAIRDIDSAAPDARSKAVSKAQGIVAGFSKHIATDARVGVCDENPFGVTLTIRKSIGGALKQLETALRAGASA